MLGANQALPKGSHVGMDYFVRKVQLAIDALLYLLTAPFSTVVAWFGVKLSLLNSERVLNSIVLPCARARISGYGYSA